MSSHNTESVTGLLDGELKGLRLWFAKRHVGTCPVCAVEYRRQQHVRRLLQANPPTATMSDSPGFFWSKVKSEIQRRGEESVEVPQPRLALADWLRQRQFAMATATALVIAACGVVWFMQMSRRAPAVMASLPAVTTPLPTVTASLPAVTASLPAVMPSDATPAGFAEVEQLKTPVPHSVATAFDSDDAGVTVIWVTGLPWTSDMTDMKTQFANMDT
jgi:hypothetical protein